MIILDKNYMQFDVICIQIITDKAIGKAIKLEHLNKKHYTFYTFIIVTLNIFSKPLFSLYKISRYFK